MQWDSLGSLREASGCSWKALATEPPFWASLGLPNFCKDTQTGSDPPNKARRRTGNRSPILVKQVSEEDFLTGTPELTQNAGFSPVRYVKSRQCASRSCPLLGMSTFLCHISASCTT